MLYYIFFLLLTCSLNAAIISPLPTEQLGVYHMNKWIANAEGFYVQNNTRSGRSLFPTPFTNDTVVVDQGDVVIFRSVSAGSTFICYTNGRFGREGKCQSVTSDSTATVSVNSAVDVVLFYQTNGSIIAVCDLSQGNCQTTTYPYASSIKNLSPKWVGKNAYFVDGEYLVIVTPAAVWTTVDLAVPVPCTEVVSGKDILICRTTNGIHYINESLSRQYVNTTAAGLSSFYLNDNSNFEGNVVLGFPSSDLRTPIKRYDPVSNQWLDFFTQTGLLTTFDPVVELVYVQHSVQTSNGRMYVLNITSGAQVNDTYLSDFPITPIDEIFGPVRLFYDDNGVYMFHTISHQWYISGGAQPFYSTANDNVLYVISWPMSTMIYIEQVDLATFSITPNAFSYSASSNINDVTIQESDNNLIVLDAVGATIIVDFANRTAVQLSVTGTNNMVTRGKLITCGDSFFTVSNISSSSTLYQKSFAPDSSYCEYVNDVVYAHSLTYSSVPGGVIYNPISGASLAVQNGLAPGYSATNPRWTVGYAGFYDSMTDTFVSFNVSGIPVNDISVNVHGNTVYVRWANSRVVALYDLCESVSDCNDGNSCTTDTCSNHICYHLANEQCTPECISNTDCDDGIPCTIDLCDMSGLCSNVMDANCNNGNNTNNNNTNPPNNDPCSQGLCPCESDKPYRCGNSCYADASMCWSNCSSYICGNGTCSNGPEECSEYDANGGCPSGTTHCPDGSCVTDASKCLCKDSSLYRCANGDCVMSASNCSKPLSEQTVITVGVTFDSITTAIVPVQLPTLEDVGSVVIPKDVVSGNVPLQVAVSGVAPTTTKAVSTPCGGKVVSPVINITLVNTDTNQTISNLNQNATITLKGDLSTKTNSSKYCLAYINGSNAWDCVDSAVSLDKGSQKVEGKTPHFSSFAVLLLPGEEEETTDECGNKIEKPASSADKGIKWAMVGSIIGAAVIVIVIAIVSTVFFVRRKRQRLSTFQSQSRATQLN